MEQTIVGYKGYGIYDAKLYMVSNFINMMKYEELKEKFNDSKAIENCQYMIDIFKKEYERAASMFSEEFQRLEQLVPDNDTLALLMNLMGKDSEPKRDFIFNNIDFSEIKE